MKLANRIMMLAICLGFCTQVEASMAQVRARSTKPLSNVELISSLEKKEKTNSLEEIDMQLLLLAQISKQALDIKEFLVDESVSTAIPEKAISRAIIVSEMHRQIQTRSLWKHHVAESTKAMIVKHRDQLKRILSDDQYVAAWVSLQIGEQILATQTLKNDFKDKFEKIMQTKDLGDLDDRAMNALNDGAAALKILLPPHDQEEVIKKVQKVKTHLSKLPNSSMVT